MPRPPATRHRRLPAVLLSALALAGGMLAASERPTPAASTSTASTVRFGLVDNRLVGAGTTAMDADLADDASLGVTAVREQLSWAAVEPSPGVYNWGPFDRIVQAAAVHHIFVLAVVDYTPGWATPPGCSSWRCAPQYPQEFAAFAHTAAARYGSAVGAWEIWNEPNSAGFWLPKPNAANYTRLLTLTSAAIRSAAPNATVVSGGLAPEANDGDNIDPRNFLSEVCADGGLSAVGAVGLHPYSYPVPPDYQAPWNAWQQMANTPVSVLGVLQACGAGSLPLWITEYGAPTDGPGAAATPTNYNLAAHPDHVSESLQAIMAQQAVQDARSYPWLGAFFWYSAQDTGTLMITNQNFFGLRRYYGGAKPAWSALQGAIAAP